MFSSASFFDLRITRPDSTLHPTPCNYVSMLWILLMQASSMYETLAQATLHPNPKLLCEYALGFTSASFFDEQKNSPRVYPCYYVSMPGVYPCKLLQCTKCSPRALYTLPHATIYMCVCSGFFPTIFASLFDVRKGYFTPLFQATI